MLKLTKADIELDNQIQERMANDGNPETEEIANLEMYDYLVNQGLIPSKEEQKICIKIRKAFRQQRDLSSSFNYEKIFVDGGKQDPNWEIIFEANKNWNRIEVLLGRHKSLIEYTICTALTKKQLFNKLGGLRFWDNVGKVLVIIGQLTRLNNSDYDNMIMELREKVEEFGFRRTCRKLTINPYSLNMILNGRKNFKFYQLEKLKRFFEIN
jgi:hypothetical protein